MRKVTRRGPRPRLIDRVVRLFHPRRFPERYTIPIPPGVELRLSKSGEGHGPGIDVGKEAGQIGGPACGIPQG